MRTISRRKFFRKTAAGPAVTGFLSAGPRELDATPLGMPIGFQTYPVRTAISVPYLRDLKV
jgi:hypothetical protein